MLVRTQLDERDVANLWCQTQHMYVRRETDADARERKDVSRPETALTCLTRDCASWDAKRPREGSACCLEDELHLNVLVS